MRADRLTVLPCLLGRPVSVLDFALVVDPAAEPSELDHRQHDHSRNSSQESALA